MCRSSSWAETSWYYCMHIDGGDPIKPEESGTVSRRRCGACWIPKTIRMLPWPRSIWEKIQTQLQRSQARSRGYSTEAIRYPRSGWRSWRGRMNWSIWRKDMMRRSGGKYILKSDKCQNAEKIEICMNLGTMALLGYLNSGIKALLAKKDLGITSLSDIIYWVSSVGQQGEIAMSERIFKRKIYEKMLRWKEESNGKTGLLIKGARRVGKSTIVEEFAKREYETYILIDFSNTSREIGRASCRERV